MGEDGQHDVALLFVVEKPPKLTLISDSEADVAKSRSGSHDGSFDTRRRECLNGFRFYHSIHRVIKRIEQNERVRPPRVIQRPIYPRRPGGVVHNE